MRGPHETEKTFIVKGAKRSTFSAIATESTYLGTLKICSRLWNGKVHDPRTPERHWLPRHSGGAATEKSIVDVANAVGSFVTRSTFVEQGRATRRQKIGVRILADVSVIKQERNVVDSAGISTLEFGKNAFAQVLSLWWSKHFKIWR